jgi:hypothetical protein
MYINTTNVEPEMYDYTSDNWSHWNSNEKLKEIMEAVSGKHSIDSLQKNLKYKSLCTKIQRMWNLKCTIIPVIIGATGIVTRSLRKKFGSCIRKIFDRFSTKDSCTLNITHNTESTAV